MTLYPFDMQLVVDPSNSSNIVTNGQVFLYHPSDVDNTTPLVLNDPNGLPQINPMMSNSNGFLGAFLADTPQVKWASAGFVGYFNSYDGLRSEAIGARDAAQEALVSAAGAVVNAAAAAASAKSAASLVGAPPDSVVKALVTTTASATRKALDGLYAPKGSTGVVTPPPPTSGGDGGSTTIIVNSGASGDSARRPLIGARVGVGSANQGSLPDNEYFDELHRLEKDMQADADVTNWYREIGPDSAENFTATVKAELKAYPNRKVLYVLEMPKSNAQFNREFTEKDGIYPHLVETLQAIKDSGYADRVLLAPFHEGNGGGGDPGSIGSYEWHMYDTDQAQLIVPSSSDYKQGAPYGNPFRVNTPEQYKQAFRNVVTLVRSMGLPCKIVQWFLAANSSDSLTVDQIDRMNMAHGYVGDQYVDIIGLSYYNRSGDSRYSDTWPQPGANGLYEFYNAFEGMTSNPLWVCESGCAPSNSQGDQAQWYADIIKLIASDELPRIEGYIMFMQDSRKVVDGKEQGANMKIDSALDIPGTSLADVVALKRLVGKAINAAKRVTKVNAIPPHSRNLLPLSVTYMTTTVGWVLAPGVTVEAHVDYTPTSFDEDVRGLRIFKPAYVAGDTRTTHNIYRRVSKVNVDYKPNDPYVLTFWARSSEDGFKVEAGIRQDGDPALTLGDELVLTTTWEQYVVPFASHSDNPVLTSWRIPNFNFGNNKNESLAWFEIAMPRLSRGTQAQPATEKRPRIKPISDSLWLNWNCEAGDIHTVTVAQSSTLMAPLGVPYDGQQIKLRLTQGGSGGHALNLHADFYSSVPHPILASGPGAKTLLTFEYDAEGGRWGMVNVAAWDLA